MNGTTLTRAERQSWERRREAYEQPIIEAARQAGRLPVIDCCDRKYPVPSHVLRELDRMNSPAAREAAYRGAAELRRKAKSLLSLASGVLERDGKGEQAESMRVKAAEYELEAAALEASVAPV